MEMLAQVNIFLLRVRRCIFKLDNYTFSAQPRFFVSFVCTGIGLKLERDVSLVETIENPWSQAVGPQWPTLESELLVPDPIFVSHVSILYLAILLATYYSLCYPKIEYIRLYLETRC